MLEVIQEEDKAKAIQNLDFMKLALDNLQLGYRQFLLDLPLDYHDNEAMGTFLTAVYELEASIKQFEKVI